MRCVIVQVIAKAGRWTWRGEAGLLCTPEPDDWFAAMTRLMTVAVASCNMRFKGTWVDVGFYAETTDTTEDREAARIIQQTPVYHKRLPGFRWTLEA